MIYRRAKQTKGKKERKGTRSKRTRGKNKDRPRQFVNQLKTVFVDSHLTKQPLSFRISDLTRWIEEDVRKKFDSRGRTRWEHDLVRIAVDFSRTIEKTLGK